MTERALMSQPHGQTPANIPFRLQPAGYATWDFRYRLVKLELALRGRIAQAQQGLPWTRDPPWGRAFDRARQEWYVTPVGHKLRELLERYVAGERLNDLVSEYGFRSSREVWTLFATRLSGVYVATFNSPELGIVDLRVPVPAIPEVISAELEAQVKERRDLRPDGRRDGRELTAKWKAEKERA